MGINLREKKVKDMSMCELAYNDCYIKDKQAMYRNYDMDVNARDLIRSIYKREQLSESPEFFSNDSYFDEIMFDNLQYGITNTLGILAILYQQIWSKASMREVLLRASKGHDIQTMV